MKLFINTAYSEIELYFYNGKESFLYKRNSINNHTIKLYELYYEALTELKIKSNDIKEISVITGPGSFTGLRVGVVFAKTLTMIWNCKINSINLIDMIYITNNFKKIALDARGSKYFCYDGKIKEIKENISDEYVIDPKINYSNFKKINTKESNYKEVKINYYKEVI